MVDIGLQGKDDTDKKLVLPCSRLLQKCIHSKQMGIVSLLILYNT